MIIQFFIVILICIPISIEIQLQCPGPQQWNIRAISHCQNKLDYVCLWNSFKLAFNEACVGPWEESGGRRTVLNLNGKQDAENCPWEYYQPENINFRTSQGDNCLYQKSLCSEVGQLIHSNGSTTADRTCRCDYTMGYAFISTTKKNPCYCVVSEEDCACYSKECDEDKILSPDYQCIRREENQTQFNCSEVHVIQKDSAIVSRSSDTEQIPVRWNYVAACIVTALSNIMFLMIRCWKFIQIRYGCCQQTFIKKHLVPMVIMEGLDVTLECEIEKAEKEQNISLKWFKDGSEILKSDDKYFQSESDGRVYKLKIDPAEPNHKGTYKIVFMNKYESEAYLDVNPFIKKHLVPMVIMEGLDVTLECEIEKAEKEQNISVKWLKDGNEISSKSDDKYFQSESDGRVYKLKIDPVEPNHKGKYKIVFMNKYESEAYLDVNPFIKKHLVPMVIMEGLDVTLECEIKKAEKKLNISVKWLKDGNEISKSDDKYFQSESDGRVYTLKIDPVEPHHKGKYKIVFMNKYESEAYLDVNPFIKKHLVPMVIMEGLDVTLECEIEKGKKEQNISVKWFKDGSEISKSDDKYFQLGSNGRVFNLKIDPAEPQHKGKYKIVFMNKYESEAYLDVNPMPTEIKDLPKESRDAFLKAAKGGTTQRYFLRIIIVGKEKSGKTCLLRRLINQEINDVKSTNCLDVASCQISLLDGKWEFLDIKNDITLWDKLADCGLWDFAGQREYYATHQIFLTPNAIYILTVDISEDLSTLTNMEMQEKEFTYVGDYINFWIDNIHCYAKQNERIEREQKNGLIYPAVILVGTGIDKYQKEEEIQDREKKLDTCIENLLGKESKRKHLWKVRTLSNTEPSEEKTEFADLRNIIYEIAKTLPKWREHLPISWIYLEKEIQKAQNTTKIMSFTDVFNLAKNCKFRNEGEVLSFLNYEHNVGNLIFFDTIKENIILDPMWLVSALKCIVAPGDFRKDFAGNLDWAELIETGLLSDRLINQLFQTQNDPLLIEQKYYVMRIMEAFNIVIKMHDGKYYLPSLIKPTTFEDIITKFNVSECKTSSWLCLDFKFLPPSFFNHILVGFISKGYKLSGECEDQPALYQGIGVFSLISESGPDSKYLAVCVFRNIVALQVWQRDTELMCNSQIRKDLIEIISNIQRRYRIDIKYKIQLLCSSGSYYKSNKRKDIFKLIKCDKFYCFEHRNFHQSDHLWCIWYTTLSEHAEANLQKTEDSDGTYRHACHECEKKPSVYWCSDCQKSMCKDCNHHHRESGGTICHVVQHVQDTYSLDYNFKVDVVGITDIKMLNDVLLVIADYYSNQLVTFDISGQQQQHTIPLHGYPHCIAVVDNNTVAVTLYDYLERFIVVIVDIEQRQVKQSITVKVRCRGITYRDNQLFVGCYDKTIKIMNMSGEVTREIQVGVAPWYICGGVGGRIYYSDRDKLYCIDTAGKTLLTFSNRDMRDPQAITTDDDDHVLVICSNSNNVLRISPDGKQSQIIINEIPSNRSYYQSIYYDLISKSIVIGQNSNVYVYKKI